MLVNSSAHQLCVPYARKRVIITQKFSRKWTNYFLFIVFVVDNSASAKRPRLHKIDKDIYYGIFAMISVSRINFEKKTTLMAFVIVMVMALLVSAKCDWACYADRRDRNKQKVSVTCRRRHGNYFFFFSRTFGFIHWHKMFWTKLPSMTCDVQLFSFGLVLLYWALLPKWRGTHSFSVSIHFLDGKLQQRTESASSKCVFDLAQSLNWLRVSWSYLANGH